MNLNYNLNIPFQNNPPSVDQPNMLTNTNSIANWVTVDHFGFQDSQGGWHSNIHQPPQGTPANEAGINQTFVRNYTPNTSGGSPDTQLFTKTGTGIVSQLTGFLTGAALGADGWQYAGGILIQWGQVISPSPNGTVTYRNRVAGAIPFPTNTFVVLTSAITNGSVPPNPITFYVSNAAGDTTNLQFKWQFAGTSSSSVIGFNWVAIGN